MALTQAQDALLTEAITNLNRSTAVNKDVLGICRSVGNTGAVDIALHNNDSEAHQNFATVHASSGFQIGTSYDTERAYARFSRSINDSQTYGNLWLDTYACQGATSHETGASGFSIRNVYFVQDWSNFVASGQNFEVSSFTARLGYIGESETRTYKTTHTLNYAVTDGKNRIYLGLANSDTGNSQFFFEERCFRPNNICDLGTSTFQFKDLYLQNSPVVSSDERLKQDIADVPEAVFRAWGRVSFKQYRFKEAVEKKGADARLHVGLIVQKILEAFEAEGLDATKYGIVCHDEWDDQYVTETITDAEAVLDEKGKVITPEKTHQEKRFVKAAGDVWTVRYEEALALETAYQRWRLSKIEAALAAKGITL
mgnify:CR=1 FL=1|jgi:hypothetical protein